MSSSKNEASISARVLLLLLAFSWGSNWIGAAFALREVPPWSLRFANVLIGAITLIIAGRLSGRNLAVKDSEFKHIIIAGIFNVGIFQVCSALAQFYGATSRAIMVAYSMPIWSAAMAWLVLGERLDRTRVVALALCICGLGILIWPLFESGLLLGTFFALGCALSWAFATIYVKKAKLTVDPIANATWQLLVGFAVITVGMLIAEGYPKLSPVSDQGVIAIFFIGIIGVGLPHFLWWAIVGKLPAVTAALGSLLVPVVGISASILVLGERPTAPDIVGFVMIFVAAACVLVQPSATRNKIF